MTVYGENIENNGCSQRDNAEHEGYVKRLGHSIGYGKKETVHSRDFLETCHKDNFNRAYVKLRQTRERRELMA